MCDILLQEKDTKKLYSYLDKNYCNRLYFKVSVPLCSQELNIDEENVLTQLNKLLDVGLIKQHETGIASIYSLN